MTQKNLHLNERANSRLDQKDDCDEETVELLL